MSISRDEQKGGAPRLRVAVIDDEPLVLSLMCELLDMGGHEFAGFTSASEALPALHASSFDVLLCDINMPEMSGVELYEYLSKALPGYCDRIVFLAGDLFEPATRSFLARTGRCYLSKPFRRAALESVLAQMAMPDATAASNDLSKAA